MGGTEQKMHMLEVNSCCSGEDEVLIHEADTPPPKGSLKKTKKTKNPAIIIQVVFWKWFMQPYLIYYPGPIIQSKNPIILCWNADKGEKKIHYFFGVQLGRCSKLTVE